MKAAKTVCALMALAAWAISGVGAQAQTLVLDQPMCAGMSGFRAHWDQPIPVAEDGQRIVKDAVVKDRGQTAVWDGVKPGPLAFDAQHRYLLVRFPDAGQKIAEALAGGKAVEKVELVLPYLDEEIWPQGRPDNPSPDGYRYRTNWDCDNYWRGMVREKTKQQTPALVYREERPNWHAIAYVLRKPWNAGADTGPTYNAAVKGAVYWKRFGASDPAEDRFATRFGPTEVSSYKPEGRMDVTAVLTEQTFGKTLTERLHALADCGFVITKEELYDHRYYAGPYEFATAAGPRAILIRQPKLVITLKAGRGEAVGPLSPVDVAALAAKHKASPVGSATAVVPTPEQVAALNQKFMARPAWMPDWQYAHLKQLLVLQRGGNVQPFYYRAVPNHVINDLISKARQNAGKNVQVPQADLDYAVYLAWLDWINGRPLRFYEGHLTAASNVSEWYNYREAIPAAVQDLIVRNWTAWLMPDRESAVAIGEMANFADVSGKLIHPMADDPRVGKHDGQSAVWGQGDTYYKKTGDWRGNKSFFRSGFTRSLSTANFNSTAVTGALLNGQIVGSARAMDDGRSGLMKFPFWMWTYGSGVGQEYIDHYYWAIATAGNKLFADYCQDPQDRMAGWSIIQKTANDLAMSYHPNLKKLLGPASRTGFEHVLGQQDGLYHILHVLSPRGALSDTDTGTLPALTMTTPDARGRTPRPLTAWGHDYPPEAVALNSMSGPWADPWISEWVDEKPLPWFVLAEKSVTTDGDWVSTWFGENYGLMSIRQTSQRIHVLGHWRRKAERPSTMRDIGTLDMRIGFNQTQLANDGDGVISQQGIYRCFQHHNKLIMLAQPRPKVIAQQAGEHSYGQAKVPAQEIKSVQCTAALFSYEQPAPAWEIYVDDQKVGALPVTAKSGQVITIRDGVAYLAIRPLPTDDIGRDADITLEAGQPQPEAYRETINIQAALLIHANFYRRGTALAAADLEKLHGARSGFVVEMGDEKEHGSFARFQQHVRGATLDAAKGAATYKSGADTLAATWDTFTVNGKDPYAAAEAGRIWQDTTLSQMGMARRMEKAGAVVERGVVTGKNPMMLQVFPRHKTYVCTNPVPGYKAYTFTTPDGVRIVADGLCSMGRWAVIDGKAIDVRHHAFDVKKDTALAGGLPIASALFVTGMKGKPSVSLNGTDIASAIKAWKHEGREGWLIPLGGDLGPEDQIAAGLKAAAAAVNEQAGP